jgi:hypothetical protein
MLMASVIYGTGKPQNCTRNGKLMTVYALECCGIHMNLVNSLLLAGMDLSSTGIKMLISIKKGRSKFFCKYCATCVVPRTVRLKEEIV